MSEVPLYGSNIQFRFNRFMDSGLRDFGVLGLFSLGSLYKNRKALHHARKVDVRLPGKGNSNSHGVRPVHLIITMIKCIRTSRLSKRTLSIHHALRLRVTLQGFTNEGIQGLRI